MSSPMGNALTLVFGNLRLVDKVNVDKRSSLAKALNETRVRPKGDRSIIEAKHRRLRAVLLAIASIS